MFLILCFINSLWITSLNKRQMAQWIKNLPAMQEMQEMWVWSLGPKIPLEQGMATHSNILALNSLWVEEPGWLQFKGWQGVGHYSTTKNTHWLLKPFLNASYFLPFTHGLFSSCAYVLLLLDIYLPQTSLFQHSVLCSNMTANISDLSLNLKHQHFNDFK